MNNKPRIIALYLPQYHPFPENDEWWGKGFTEWTNVGRAKPLFRGHYQPKIPADLGYYDLRLPIVREQQAALAKEAGIEGFCYWHYWFGNGKTLMGGIFDEVLQSGKPDYPFCLGWANHSWYAKNWNSNDAGKKDRLLIEQTYPGADDIRMHYDYVLRAFKDPRYIKMDNKPFFMIYNGQDLPNEYIELWNKWAKEDGFDGVFFVCNIAYGKASSEFQKRGFDAVIRDRIKSLIDKRKHKNKFAWLKAYAMNKVFGVVKNAFEYSDVTKELIGEEDFDEFFIPNLVPNFDHSPRSGAKGIIFKNSTPQRFKEHCQNVLNIVENKKNKFVMLRSWNEWGEGNYMEPDIRYGHGYIDALKSALKGE